MSVSPFRIIHHISVIAKPFLIFILALYFTAGHAQKNTGTKPDESYTQAIKNGDKLLQAGDFLHALNEFEKALILSPSQIYPQEKIAQIEKTLADSQFSNSLFEASITNGEKYFAAKDYKNAKTEYLNAMRLDPEAQYPKDRLAEISKVFIDPEDEALYNSAVKSAGIALGKTEYDEAIGFYNQALVIKPGDKALKTLIIDANRLKSELAAKKDIYNKSIATADKLLEQKKYAEARAEYSKALATIPGENYPNGKIASIDQLLAANKANDDTYAAIVDGADKLYIARDFDNARIRYQQALNLRAGERYPKSMLEKADMGQTEVRTIQQRYDAAIANADNLFKAAEMDAALIGYQSASIILPNETYPKTKIAEINKIVSDRNSRQDAYRIAISNGDQAFEAASYPRALNEYKNALSLQPGEDYPKTRIAAIEALVLKEKDSQDSYNKAIASADRDFGMKKYPDAITGYQSALTLKPAEKYPQDKITEINGILANQKSVRENYDMAIINADKTFNEKNYSLALTAYQTALGLKPSETYPKGKISEINSILGQQKAIQDNYDRTIEAGNKAFSEKDYPLALTSFQSAFAIKPAETYSQEKITEIEGILAKQRSLQENYDKAIIAADKDLAEKKYPEALNGYQSALVLKPAETYPQGKINEINGMLGQQKDLQNNYDKTIAAADKSFVEKDFPLALTSFQSALAIKPAEKYPQEKITEIEGILAKQRSLQENYDKAIIAADKDFGAQKYPEAITGFKSALTLKPAEKYPQDKITEINGILANQKSVRENYDMAIINADKTFSEKNYPLALTAYQMALGLKPSETYPKGKISEINSILGQQKAIQDNYDRTIEAGNKAFSEKDYPLALTSFQSAFAIKPAETYSQEKITEIAGILAKQRSLQENYDKAIIAAEMDLAEKKYPEALNGYQSALVLKPAETYPQGKINEINSMLGQQKDLQNNYDKTIVAADKSFVEKDFPLALTSFQSALAIKPTEKYPQEKIAEINTILLRQKEIQDNYDKAIAAADKDFGAQKYPEAITGFKSALALKPIEKYPQDKISEINGIIANQKSVQENYDKAIIDADKSFSGKNYPLALTAYQMALGLKPSETYPKGKISDINSILGQQKELQDSYDKAIADADKSFGKKEYTEATEGYKSALLIKPSESYPQEKITEIIGLLAKQNVLNESYSKAIVNADKAFGEKDYSLALTGYQSALGLKPEETYPKEKINAINATFAADKEKTDQNYADLISKADADYAKQDYTNARISYQQASSMKPGEAYPKDKLTEITNLLLAQGKEMKDDYDRIIVDADKAYAARIFDQAIGFYENAITAKPDESYPGEMIAKIQKYMAEHSIVNVTKETFMVLNNTEKRFSFKPIDASLRKNNYVVLKARNPSGSKPKVYLNYGRDSAKNGGIVLRSITNDVNNDFIIRISVQDKWYREDNNWLSLYSEGGDIEISSIQIAQGD